MDKHVTVRDILAGIAAAVILTGALVAVYGWLLGVIFGVFISVAGILVSLRIIR